MKKVFIIGCGLLGSSLVRRISKKKIANKIVSKYGKAKIVYKSIGHSKQD